MGLFREYPVWVWFTGKPRQAAKLILRVLKFSDTPIWTKESNNKTENCCPWVGCNCHFSWEWHVRPAQNCLEFNCFSKFDLSKVIEHLQAEGAGFGKHILRWNTRGDRVLSKWVTTMVITHKSHGYKSPEWVISYIQAY